MSDENATNVTPEQASYWLVELDGLTFGFTRGGTEVITRALSDPLATRHATEAEAREWGNTLEGRSPWMKDRWKVTEHTTISKLRAPAGEPEPTAPASPVYTLDTPTGGILVDGKPMGSAPPAVLKMADDPIAGPTRLALTEKAQWVAENKGRKTPNIDDLYNAALAMLIVSDAENTTLQAALSSPERVQVEAELPPLPEKGLIEGEGGTWDAPYAKSDYIHKEDYENLRITVEAQLLHERTLRLAAEAKVAELEQENAHLRDQYRVLVKLTEVAK